MKRKKNSKILTNEKKYYNEFIFINITAYNISK